MPFSLQELLSQLRALVPEDAPWTANDEGQRGNFRCERCLLCNDCRFCKDCQQCRECTYCEHCEQCESCTQCRRCLQCRDASYLEDCRACARSSYLILCLDCEDCVHCLGCVGLRNAEFCILNQPVERQAYFEQLRALRAEIETKVRGGWRIAELGDCATPGSAESSAAEEACGSGEEAGRDAGESAREGCDSGEELVRDGSEAAREECGQEEAMEAGGSGDKEVETARAAIDSDEKAVREACALEKAAGRAARASREEAEETAREACALEEEAVREAQDSDEKAGQAARASKEEAEEAGREACESEKEAARAVHALKAEAAQEGCALEDADAHGEPEDLDPTTEQADPPSTQAEHAQQRAELMEAQARDLTPIPQAEFEARLAHLDAPRSPKSRAGSDLRPSLWQRRLSNRGPEQSRSSSSPCDSPASAPEGGSPRHQGWNRGLAARPLPSPRGPARWRGAKGEEQAIRQDGSPSAWLPSELSSTERRVGERNPSKSETGERSARDRALRAQTLREQIPQAQKLRAQAPPEPLPSQSRSGSPNRLLAFVKSGAAKAKSEDQPDQKSWARAKLPPRKGDSQV